MRVKVLSPMAHNGKDYEIGSVLELPDGIALPLLGSVLEFVDPAESSDSNRSRLNDLPTEPEPHKARPRRKSDP